MKSKLAAMFFLLLGNISSAMAVQEIPAAPFYELIRQNQDRLTVRYLDGDGHQGDSHRVDGRKYSEAAAIIDGQYSRPAEWKCYIYPENSKKRLCIQTFQGGNFDGSSFYIFRFYFVEDKQGIRFQRNEVEAFHYYD